MERILEEIKIRIELLKNSQATAKGRDLQINLKARQIELESLLYWIKAYKRCEQNAIR